jgi:putative DNA primase/helicase
VKGPEWFVWDGKRWVADNDAAYRAAKETARRIRLEAAAIQGDKSDAVFRHARNSESRGRIEAMVALASKGEIAHMGLVVPIERLDQPSHLLNCTNGTVNLKTGKLSSHRKDDFLTHLVDVAYDPAAKAPLWERTLREVFDGDDELIAWVRRAFGYSATGEPNPEKTLFIPHGTGDNGKSLIVETITDVLGGLAHVAAADTFVTSNLRHGNIQNDLASMRGARLVRVPETDDGERLARQVIKTITGGDTIKARFLYREHFEYRPRFKVWIVTNHLPNVPHTDRAAWSRIRVIPFRREFGAGEQNRKLRTLLQKEREGILTWIVCGAYEWYRHGLGEPPLAVAEATFDYRTSQDTISQFVEHELLDDADGRVSKTELFDLYKDWCRGEGRAAIGRTAFHTALRDRGYLEKKDSFGNRYYAGIRQR